METSQTIFRNLSHLEEDVVKCRKCERLVTFREKIAKEKRKSYMDWDYWGTAVPGYGNPKAKIMILDWLQLHMEEIGLAGSLQEISQRTSYLNVCIL